MAHLGAVVPVPRTWTFSQLIDGQGSLLGTIIVTILNCTRTLMSTVKAPVIRRVSTFLIWVFWGTLGIHDRLRV